MTIDVDVVLERIKVLLAEKHWSLYKLADVCNLPHTSLYTMMQRHTMPKLDTLDTICKGFGITLSDFFASISDPKSDEFIKTIKEKLLFELTQTMDNKQIELLLTYAQGLYDASHK